MKLKVETFDALCSMKVFEINGIRADTDDFGEQWDHAQDEADPYGCGDMRFERKDCSQEVLNKYKITEKEYDKIASKLEGMLSFGACGWCI